jgi:hypothetical protein
MQPPVTTTDTTGDTRTGSDTLGITTRQYHIRHRRHCIFDAVPPYYATTPDAAYLITHYA